MTLNGAAIRELLATHVSTLEDQVSALQQIDTTSHPAPYEALADELKGLQAKADRYLAETKAFLQRLTEATDASKTDHTTESRRTPHSNQTPQKRTSPDPEAGPSNSKKSRRLPTRPASTKSSPTSLQPQPTISRRQSPRPETLQEASTEGVQNIPTMAKQEQPVTPEKVDDISALVQQRLAAKAAAKQEAERLKKKRKRASVGSIGSVGGEDESHLDEQRSSNSRRKKRLRGAGQEPEGYNHAKQAGLAQPKLEIKQNKKDGNSKGKRKGDVEADIVEEAPSASRRKRSRLG